MLVHCVLVDNIEKIPSEDWEEEDDYYQVTTTRLDSVYQNFNDALKKKEELDDKLNVEEYAYIRSLELQ